MKHDENTENTVMHNNEKKKNLDFLFLTILLLLPMFFLLLLYFCKSDNKNYNLIKKFLLKIEPSSEKKEVKIKYAPTLPNLL
jgi:hypothetical protein